MPSPNPSLEPGPDQQSVRLAAAEERIAALERSDAALRARLCESEARHRHTCELRRLVPWSAAPNGDILEMAPLWTTLTGLELEDSLGTGWVAAVHPEDREPAGAIWRQALATGEAADGHFRLVMSEGEPRWFHLRIAPRTVPDGSLSGWYGTLEDIQERRSAEEALKASEALTRSVLESTTDHVVVLDRDWRITFMNARATKLIAQMCEGKAGDGLWDLFPDHQSTEYEARCREAMETGRPVRFEARMVRADGWLTLNVCPTGDGLAVFFRDTTDVMRASEALVEQAHRDDLTGLANRALFNKALEEGFEGRTERDTSVLLLDLDLFKEVNDTLGHPVGDKLLKEVALRFRSSLDEGDLLARLGGDEFAVIHRPGDDGRSVAALAERLMESFTDCFFVDGIAIKLAASIGTASSSPAHLSANDLFKAADIALYRAKEEGRGAIRAFDDGMAERLQARQTMKVDLDVALVLGELRLVYQPLLDIASGRIAGAEALVRWRHPTMGEISPGEFIPLAEDTGLIVEMGDWILRQACMQAALWPGERTVAVNLSPVQIRDETLPQRVLYALSNAGIAPSRLELEITESVLLQDSERNLAMLHTLREAGVRIALDDFGTGYSSLSYLRHFPFDKLKLDRCFVGDIGRSPQSEAIIRAAGEMGRAMAMTTTAEGVETAEQLDWLRANGWSQAQGWHTGRPMEAGAIRDLLVGGEARRRKTPARHSPLRTKALAG
ncbi:bifunctional diguanylate cyclase/phosphodiesterase [Aureimonas sp. SK2]|uniref:putative bifunctional diguanylate cyclase/phosphodiesterase n=1 Tax=Aureimonas sp. SK2 TaxID=3015992 RepID=UPI00244431DB|nr:bifunctional diguanylate cyclase/phosphodiesterase [Aureimonas sp. SK2]